MFCRECGTELAGGLYDCFSCGARPVTSPGNCATCDAVIMPLARECLRCGTRQKKSRRKAASPLIYDASFDLGTLSDRQRREFSQHSLMSAFSSDGVIILHILTLGVFTLIYFGLMHSRLPIIKHDDFGARRAIGFSFIPFFNLYWLFRFWLRLVDRVNFQIRLRGLPPTISRRLMLATCIVSVIPGANLAALVMYPICIGQIQSACNIIVPEQSGEYRMALESV